MGEGHVPIPSTCILDTRNTTIGMWKAEENNLQSNPYGNCKMILSIIGFQSLLGQ